MQHRALHTTLLLPLLPPQLHVSSAAPVPDPLRRSRHQTAQQLCERLPREPPRSSPYKQNPQLRSALYDKNTAPWNKGKTSKQTKWCVSVSPGWRVCVCVNEINLCYSCLWCSGLQGAAGEDVDTLKNQRKCVTAIWGRCMEALFPMMQNVKIECSFRRSSLTDKRLSNCFILLWKN